MRPGRRQKRAHLNLNERAWPMRGHYIEKLKACGIPRRSWRRFRLTWALLNQYRLSFIKAAVGGKRKLDERKGKCLMTAQSGVFGAGVFTSTALTVIALSWERSGGGEGGTCLQRGRRDRN